MTWVILILSVVFIYNYIQISKPFVNQVNIKSKKVYKNIRITQISDFHSNKYIDLDKLFKIIEEYNPHIIAITGDIIDCKTENLELALDLLKRTRKINSNVFFVAGNHEDRNLLYPELANKMTSLGISILNNE